MSSVDFKAWRKALECAELRMEAIEQAAARLSALTAELREVREERRSFGRERVARHEREIEGDPGEQTRTWFRSFRARQLRHAFTERWLCHPLTSA